jgi:hypothetical protein
MGHVILRLAEGGFLTLCVLSLEGIVFLRFGTRTLCVLSIMVLWSSTVSFGQAEARDNSKGAKLVVNWLDPERLLPVGFEITKAEVAQLFHSTGIEIIWERDSSPSTKRTPGELTVILRSKEPPEWGTGDPVMRDRIMGAVEPGSPVIWVCLSNVTRTLGRSRTPMNGTIGLARALGRVVAHELIHTLLPAHSHTSEGLMKARWTRSYLRRPEVRLDEDCVRALQSFFF